MNQFDQHFLHLAATDTALGQEYRAQMSRAGVPHNEIPYPLGSVTVASTDYPAGVTCSRTLVEAIDQVLRDVKAGRISPPGPDPAPRYAPNITARIEAEIALVAANQR